MDRHDGCLLRGDLAGGRSLMWLKGEEGQFYLEVQFEHLHDGQRHRHDALVADVEAHQLCHRLEGRKDAHLTLQ